VGDAILDKLCWLKAGMHPDRRSYVLASALYHQRSLLINRAHALAAGNEEQQEIAKELAAALTLAEQFLADSGDQVDSPRTPCQAIAGALAA
jgi:hypothetical protein